MEFILFSVDIDRLKLQYAQKSGKAQGAAGSKASGGQDILAANMPMSSKQIVFASNTLFWLGIACLEAPNHLIRETDDSQSNQNASFT